MGKTAVFVLALLHRIDMPPDPCTVIVLSHTRELAYQIKNEFDRFSKHLRDLTTEVYYGGVSITEQITKLKTTPPSIIVGTPGRILALAKRGALKLDKIKFFVMDECDKMLEQVDMRSEV